MKLTTPPLCWMFFCTYMSSKIFAGSFFAMLPSCTISPRSTPTPHSKGASNL